MKTSVLNLSSNFNPVPASVEIFFDKFKFSGGECHLKLYTPTIIQNENHVVVTHRVNSMDNVMEVLMAKDALKTHGINNVDLVMPYIPYARQDRIMDDGESFSLKVFATILNTANFNKVTCLDSHSNVAPALINNYEEMSRIPYVRQAMLALPDDLLLINPDAGAKKKNLALAFKTQRDLISCDKKRNIKTGTLYGFEVYADDLKGKPCLIVDDICDGGGTFIGLATELIKKNAGPLYLFVTHGIFSKGLEPLLAYFDHIYTTNSITDIDNPKLTQIKVETV